jgi:hypothetical protein
VCSAIDLPSAKLLICRPQENNNDECHRFAGDGDIRRRHPDRSRYWEKNMKKIIFVGLIALGLAACEAIHDRDVDHRASLDSKKPQVNFRDGQYIVVDQEPLVFTPDEKNVIITWDLPKTGGYRFGENGIRFREDAAKEIVDCKPVADGLKFQCLNVHSHPGRYKYTITVEKDRKPLPPEDPSTSNL